MLKELRDMGFSDEGISLAKFKQIASRHGYDNVNISTMNKLFIFRDSLDGQKVIPRGWYFRTCERMFENVRATGCSFGIEFEGGIQRENGTVTGNAVDTYAHVGKWGIQHDGTAGFEIWTPIIKSGEEGAKEISAQWKHWANRNPGYLPYWRCNRMHNSMGHHVHIGKPTRSLTRVEKTAIASSVIPILPAVYFISANSPYRFDGQIMLSKRMKTSCFCKTITEVLHYGEHRWEIEDSHHGTVEFRGLDCNFPQITATCALLLKNAADLATQNATLDNHRELVAKYRQLKDDVLKNKILGFIKARKQLGEKLPSFKPERDYEREILYLALVLNENPAQFVGKMKPEFVKNLIEKHESFFDNVRTKKNSKLIDALKEDAEKYKNVGEMCSAKIKCYSKKKLYEIWTRLKRECDDIDKAKSVLDHEFDFRADWFAEIKDKKLKVREQPKRVFQIGRAHV